MGEEEHPATVAPVIRFIRCGNPQCNSLLKITSIPKACPCCSWPFDHRIEKPTSTDAILDAVTHTDSTRGYMEADAHGWVKGESLPMPEDLAWCITGEPD